MIDWNRPIVTKSGKQADLLDSDYTWEKGLQVKLVKVYGDASGDVLIPCLDDGTYAKKANNDDSFDVINEVQVITSHGLQIRVGGSKYMIMGARAEDFPSSYQAHVVKVEAPIIEMTAEEFLEFGLEVAAARKAK